MRLFPGVYDCVIAAPRPKQRGLDAVNHAGVEKWDVTGGFDSACVERDEDGFSGAKDGGTWGSERRKRGFDCIYYGEMEFNSTLEFDVSEREG